MKIKEVTAKSIISKSGIPGSDYVINPYTGCMHGCAYCYAQFMKRFTNHDEPWGHFVDVKINADELIKFTNKYKGKSILLSSVTDPYHPVERRYKLMRKILAKLIPLKADVCVLTKSDLITRDIDLLKKLGCEAGVSLAIIDGNISKKLEPLASSPERRISAVKELRKAGIRNFIFISPIMPFLSDWKNIIEQTKDFVDEYWFENLNIKSARWPAIKSWLKNNYPELLKKYEAIYFTKNNYWNDVEKEIRSFCREKKVNHKIYFHHGSHL
jgi:DNA repair photolyase